MRKKASSAQMMSPHRRPIFLGGWCWKWNIMILYMFCYNTGQFQVPGFRMVNIKTLLFKELILLVLSFFLFLRPCFSFLPPIAYVSACHVDFAIVLSTTIMFILLILNYFNNLCYKHLKSFYYACAGIYCFLNIFTCMLYHFTR